MLLWRIRNFHVCHQNDSVEKAMPAFVILIANLVQDFNTLSTLGKKLPFFLLSIFIIIIFSYALVEAIVAWTVTSKKRTGNVLLPNIYCSIQRKESNLYLGDEWWTYEQSEDLNV